MEAYAIVRQGGSQNDSWQCPLDPEDYLEIMAINPNDYLETLMANNPQKFENCQIIINL